jgi:hypothetical protein
MHENPGIQSKQSSETNAKTQRRIDVNSRIRPSQIPQVKERPEINAESQGRGDAEKKSHPTEFGIRYCYSIFSAPRRLGASALISSP